MKWRCCSRRGIRALRYDSCERRRSTHVHSVSHRVIPPRVAFNRVVAVQALKRHGPNAIPRTAANQFCANTRADSMSGIIRDCNGTSTKYPTRSSTPEVKAANIAHVKTRVLEASKTCQQISNGSDVLEFVMKLTDDVGTRNTLGAGSMGRPCGGICSGLLKGLLP
jgi:hypothetical protein